MIDMFKIMWAAITGNKKLISDSPIYLHNHDLDKWNYLGRAEIIWNITSDTTKTVTPHYAEVFFFDKKTDPTERSFTLVNPSSLVSFDRHPWITVEAHLWLAGERELYKPIITEPSQYLKEKMKKDNNWTWDTNKKWWIHNDDVPYDNAVAKQEKKTNRKKKVNVETEDNVVKINFGREKENV